MIINVHSLGSAKFVLFDKKNLFWDKFLGPYELLFNYGR